MKSINSLFSVDVYIEPKLYRVKEVKRKVIREKKRSGKHGIK